MFEPPLDPLWVNLDADRDASVERHRQRLRSTHAPQTRGQGDRARQRIAEALARDGGERLIGPLQDALGPDVDPRARGHLAIHRQPEGFEATELGPGRPLGDQHRVGDQNARGPLVGVEDANRLAGLHEQRLVALQPPQLADDRIERFPRARGPARTSIDDQVLRMLCHLRVEVVHQHPHRRLLGPTKACELGSPRRPDYPPGSPAGRAQGAFSVRRVGVVGPAHASAPTTDSAASTIAPLRISAAAAASSGATTRSGPAPPTCLRRTSRTDAVAGEGSSGRRSSWARAAAHSSTARMCAKLSSTVRSFRAAPHPIDTWSSCMPEVGIESTLAGAARRRFSATSAAAVYWATIRPELTPGSSARNGGRPCERCGSSRRSTRRSAIDPISAAAIARKSAANARGSPWKLPLDSTSPFSSTIGLSIVDDSSTSATRRAKSSVSRAAPATCGLHRTE